MGYSTHFAGTLTVTPPLNEHERGYLADFAQTRQTSPDRGQLVVESTSIGYVSSYFSGNTPQGNKPEIWCHWVPDEAGNLVWNEAEKTHAHEQWLTWLIEHLLGPASRDFVQQRLGEDPRLEHFTHDHIINGIVDAQGDDPDDMWRIRVTENTVEVQHPEITYPD